MSWFKVDDGLPVSRKVMSIPRTIRLSSIGLWTLAGAWSAAEELDGHVPGFMVAELGGTEKAASALVKSGLWEKVSDGYQFSKWAEYQPTRADMDERRKREADRKREWRKRKRPASVPAGQTVGHHAESAKCPRYPDPTRPDPLTTDVVSESYATSDSSAPPSEVHSAPKRATKGTRLDPSWIPDPDLIAAMRAERPDVDMEAEHRVFVDYWIAQPGTKGTKLDWAATWRNWIRRAKPSANAHRDPTRSGWDDLKTSTDRQIGA